MAARAIWKAELQCGGETIPVGLYSAVEDRSIRFHLLHDQDQARLKMRLRDKRTEEPVEYSEAQRGFEIDPGVYVVLDAADLESLDPPASRDIEVTRFVSPDAISHPLYDRPYYLVPDPGAEDAYFALAAALDESEQVGIARWVMRKKEYAGALRSDGQFLMLITLRHAEEVLDEKDLEAPGGAKPSAKEVELARQLVAALEEEFDPEAYRDDYRDRVAELIESKSRGKKVRIKKFKAEKPQKASLAKLLEASISSGKK